MFLGVSNYGSSVKAIRKVSTHLTEEHLLYSIHLQNNIKKDKRNLVRFK